MKTHPRCLVCLLGQAHRVSKIVGCNEDEQSRVLQAVATTIAGCDPQLSPPANAERVYTTIADVTGCRDPYKQLKQRSNELANSYLPSLREELIGTGRQTGEMAEDDFLLALRFSVAGNIIDYGALADFDLAATLDRCRHAELAVDHCLSLIETLRCYPGGADILYLADNCGEIVFDSLLLENLFQQGHRITVAVKESPIINDALYEDAVYAGLPRFAKIISNGTCCPGTVLSRCSEEFMEHFIRANIIISKGQGNFESLSTENRDIFFLLTVKCGVAARHLQELSGVSEERLQGKGEFAVYYSGKNREMSR